MKRVFKYISNKVKKSSNFTQLCIVHALLCVSFVGCQNNEFVAPPLQSVIVMQPEIGNVEYTLEYPGYTVSDYIVDLTARASGFLESKLYVSGSFVKKGDLLFVIEPQPYLDRVDGCTANLASAEASLSLAEAKLQRVLDAAKSNAVSEMDVIQAESDVASSQASVKSNKALLETAKINLSYCYIKAPFDGSITTARVDVGNYVNGQVLATIYKDNIMYVSFYMSDVQYTNVLQKMKTESKKKAGDIIIGKAADIILGDSLLTYRGYIDYVDPSVDLSTGTIKLRIRVENNDYSLKNGLYVTVRVPYADNPDAILIPDASIGRDQSGSYVYVVGKDSIVHYNLIKPGVLRSDNMREVVGGLTKEDYIVKEALLKVRDGVKVIPIYNK